MQIQRIIVPLTGGFLLLLVALAAAAGAGRSQAWSPASSLTTPTATLTATATVSATPVITAAAYLPAVRRDPTPTPTNTPSPTPPPTPTGIPPDNLTFEEALLSQINAERQANGLPPLALDGRLTQSARRHARDMADNNQLSHTGSDGSSAGQRITAAGYLYSWHGENIGWGFTSPDAMMAWWLNSAPHRANILHTQYTDIGIAYATNSGSTYTHHWVLNFGRPAAGSDVDPTLQVCIRVAQGKNGGASALIVAPVCP